MRNNEHHRLPIKLDSTSNGEYAPIPLGAIAISANRAAHEAAEHAARRLSLSRRDYLKSACGAAATLGAFNQVFAAAGRSGGRYTIEHGAAFEPQLAQANVGASPAEFIFDVQLHHVNPEGAWRRNAGWENALKNMPNAGCGESDAVRCFSRERLLKDVFLDSDTSMAVLSHVPGTIDNNPLSHEDAVATKKILDALDGTERLLIHGRVHPNVPGELERMDAQVNSARLAGFKTYTQFGSGASEGYWLDDEKFGVPMIERARKLGVRNICIHKGIPLGRRGAQFAGCRDIGAAAQLFPDMNFIVYHAGFLPARGEGPYDKSNPSGVDDLIDSLRAHQITPNRNVYAELGTTWRIAMRDPNIAAHLLGKLLKHVGENNVLWGTDSIWYGSPQDQIQAFRAFEISAEFQEKFGYPKLTSDLKRKVFGLNGAQVYGLKLDALRPKLDRDRVKKAQIEYAPTAEPSFETYGPRTRREFVAFKRAELSTLRSARLVSGDINDLRFAQQVVT
jgi:predicted TIM-barrel fold metal-dependent hydrolase